MAKQKIDCGQYRIEFDKTYKNAITIIDTKNRKCIQIDDSTNEQIISLHTIGIHEDKDPFIYMCKQGTQKRIV